MFVFSRKGCLHILIYQHSPSEAAALRLWLSEGKRVLAEGPGCTKEASNARKARAAQQASTTPRKHAPTLVHVQDIMITRQLFPSGNLPHSLHQSPCDSHVAPDSRHRSCSKHFSFQISLSAFLSSAIPGAGRCLSLLLPTEAPAT